MSHCESTDRFDRRTFMRRASLAAASATGFSLLRPSPARAGTEKIRVRVWAEGTAPPSIYPDDVDGAIGDSLRRLPGFDVQQARLAMPEAGLSEQELDSTDVLIWWGRLRHGDLPDDRARSVAERVRAGRLGFVALHASCGSKPFQELMSTSCEPGGWREDGRPEHVTILAPDHELARGVTRFTIPRTAMFSEPFKVPDPETVVMVSKFEGGETFRSGLTWTVDKGRVVYFRPGHDAFPILFHPSVRKIIANAARWAAPAELRDPSGTATRETPTGPGPRQPS
ncbi:ThuA domain-containing protein [Tundrisphaera lichenicola]|uniref:ThuA domain-containing protein n=1 Tax=Tundrisphaera lichenicola TaxID=2029860 RepID=UPI003EBD1349